MDRATLEGLIQEIFERGRKKGLAGADMTVDDTASNDGDKTLAMRAIETEIKCIWGIGEKCTEEIMRIFEKHLGIMDEGG